MSNSQNDYLDRLTADQKLAAKSWEAKKHGPQKQREAEAFRFLRAIEEHLGPSPPDVRAIVRKLLDDATLGSEAHWTLKWFRDRLFAGSIAEPQVEWEITRAHLTSQRQALNERRKLGKILKDLSSCSPDLRALLPPDEELLGHSKFEGVEKEHYERSIAWHIWVEEQTDGRRQKPQDMEFSRWEEECSRSLAFHLWQIRSTLEWRLKDPALKKDTQKILNMKSSELEKYHDPRRKRKTLKSIIIEVADRLGITERTSLETTDKALRKIYKTWKPVFEKERACQEAAFTKNRA